MKPTTTSNSVLVVIGVVVAVLVVVAVVLAVQPPKTFDTDTPEGAVQRYYEAVLDGDDDLASTYMTEDLNESCGREFRYFDKGEDARIVIVASRIEDDRAELDVTIEVSYGDGPFGGGSYDQDETVRLERHGDRWLISEPTWPMDRYGCGEFEG
ncbi:MAG: hypothetical protein V3S28_05565 [Acidimicrobiia bacterium]